jgi:hypothetical protein
VGVPVVLTNAGQARDAVRDARAQLPAGRWCLWAGDEWAGDTDLAAVRALIEELRVA